MNNDDSSQEKVMKRKIQAHNLQSCKVVSDRFHDTFSNLKKTQEETALIEMIDFLRTLEDKQGNCLSKLIDCKVLHQHDHAFTDLKKKYKTNDSEISGYLACAVATYLRDNLETKSIDNYEDFVKICIQMNTENEAFMEYVENAMEFIQSNRQKIQKLIEDSNQKPSKGWYTNWNQRWVSNSEISDFITNANKAYKEKRIEYENYNTEVTDDDLQTNPNLLVRKIHFYRSNILKHYKNIIKDIKRGDPIAFYEATKFKQELSLNQFEKNNDFYYIKDSENCLILPENWKEKRCSESKPQMDIFIVDCLGQYAVAIPISFRTQDGGYVNKVIMFNSLYSQLPFYKRKGSLEVVPESKVSNEVFEKATVSNFSDFYDDQKSNEPTFIYFAKHMFHGARFPKLSKNIYDLIY